MSSAAILAGGRATRFGGRDKGALLVDGQSIRDRQILMLSRVADDIMIVGGGPAWLPDPVVRLVADRFQNCGPLGGVHAAIANAAHDTVFVAACDMPFLTAPFVAHLLDLARHADAVLPRTERGYHPLAAVYTRACLDAIERRIARHELKMTALLDDVRVRVVESEEIEKFGDRHRLLANVNTPADYAGLEALQGHKP